MPLTLTKDMCGVIARKHLAEKNLMEFSSGKGDDFCDALAGMLFDVGQHVYNDIKLVHNLHIHAYTPPATVTGVVTVPMV